ncbi:MAG TPA: DUF47 family protein [Chloroflexota bacterium]|nr:DUF47 family protein [Chloroflexota bacterium]
MFKLRLLPRDTRFFDLFEASSVNMVEAAQKLLEMVEKFDRLDERARELKDLEHRGDSFTHQIINDLHRTFIPPLEREDIVALAESMDDVVDAIEEAASRMVLYRVQRVPTTAKELAHLDLQVAEEINRTIPLLRRKEDMPRIIPATHEINRLENEADDAVRRGLTELFEGESDVRTVIKWREIYEFLEAATDRGEDVANVLEGVVLKTA